MNLYNGEILDYKYSNKNDNNLVIPVVSNIANNSLLHPDQGVQFTSYEYTRILKEKM